MAYVDYVYYANTYLGKALDANDFPRLAERASERIDAITRYRAAGYLSAHPEDQRVKNAVCAIAEILARSERGDLLSGEDVVQSEEVGKHHITYAAPMNTASQEGQRAIDKQIMRTAITYLLPTGLLYRGVRRC